MLHTVQYHCRGVYLDRPNAFPGLNQYARNAAVAHRLDDATADTVVVERTWPASTDQLTAATTGWDPTAATHAGTAAGPATAVVDATGIVSPIPLQDLGGNQFPVHGCWSDGPGADFKALAAAQHPEALSDPAGWAVLVGDEAEEPSDTVDLADVALRLARGELTLAEPWLLVWKPVEGAEGGAAAVADSDAQGAGDGEDEDGRRVRAKLAV